MVGPPLCKGAGTAPTTMRRWGRRAGFSF